MKVINLKTGDIKPYWRNPRNNDAAVEAVKASIERYGFNSPLVLDADNVIIAGHTRYRALVEMGAKEIPCVVMADLSPEKVKEYRIADNKTSEFATWYMDSLIPELREVGSFEDMQVFFGSVELRDLMSEATVVSHPTQAQIDQKQSATENRFTESVAQVQGQYVDVICPHCGEGFFVDKSEINRTPGQDTQ